MPVHGLPPRSNERSGSSPRHAKSPRRHILRWVVLAFALLACGALAALVFGVGMTWSSMVRDDGPAAHARWTLVLDGWAPEGERAEKGLELLRAGRTDSLLLSGSRVAKELWTSTFHFHGLAVDSTLRGRVGELRHLGLSTLDEAFAATAFFRSRGQDTVLIVTSDYHTDRAASIFAQVAGGKPVYLVVPALETRFAGPWSREHSKTWLLEATKRLHWALLERWRTSPLAPGEASPVAWTTALRDSAGKSPLLRSSCPPPVVCPAPIVCPPPVEPVVVPCPEPARTVPAKSEAKEKSPTKTPVKAQEPTKAKSSVKAKASSKTSTDAKKKATSKDKDKR